MSLSKCVLLGTTGAGKSTFGNGIVQLDVFKTSNGMCSQTKEHQEHTITVDGRVITVVDTQGLCDTEDSQTIVRSRITDAIKTCASVSIFFTVFKFSERLTHEKVDALDFLVSGILGTKCYNNIVVVFTDSPQEFVESDAQGQQWLIAQKQVSEPMKTLLDSVNNRCLFVNFPPISDRPAVEDANVIAREVSRDTVLLTIKSFNPPVYKLEAVQQAQQEYDAKLAELERQKLKAASDKEKAAIDAAIKATTGEFEMKIASLTRDLIQKNDEIRNMRNRKRGGFWRKLVGAFGF